jgi:hypothetical protein
MDKQPKEQGAADATHLTEMKSLGQPAQSSLEMPRPGVCSAQPGMGHS